ncbi:MAG: threonylcarbamoyl-AMP synthase [Bacteroidales bacterium]|nr:threonylcarbamoyl-AMP synthase [Bacteroidales bacterium]
MLIKIYPQNPKLSTIDNIVERLKNGAVIIIPTDTVYSFACDMKNIKAAQKMAELKGKKLDKAHFSLVCRDLSDLSQYSRQIGNHVFKIMKKNLPGPFTFILNASSNVPKIFQSKKKTIGIRVPDNSITQILSERLGNPLMVTSIKGEDIFEEYLTDPELIREKFDDKVAVVIDGGYGLLEASTVVSCIDDDVEILRDGVGELIF